MNAVPVVSTEGSIPSSPAEIQVSENSSALLELEKMWGTSDNNYFHYAGTIGLITFLQLIWFIQYKRGITRKSISVSHKCISRYHQYYKLPVALLSHAGLSSHDHHRRRRGSGSTISSNNQHTSSVPNGTAESNVSSHSTSRDLDEENAGEENSNDSGPNNNNATRTSSTRAWRGRSNTVSGGGSLLERWHSCYAVARSLIESLFMSLCYGSLSGLPLLTLNTHLLWKVRTLELLLGGSIRYLQCLTFLCAFTMLIQYGIKFTHLKWLLQPIRVEGSSILRWNRRANPHEQHERAVQTVNQRRQQYEQVLNMGSSSFTPIIMVLLHIHSHMTWTIIQANTLYFSSSSSGTGGDFSSPVKHGNHHFFLVLALFVLSRSYYQNSVLHGGWFCGVATASILEFPLIWDKLPFQEATILSPGAEKLGDGLWFILFFLIATSAKAGGGERGNEEGEQGTGSSSVADSTNINQQGTVSLLQRWTKLLIPCLEYVAWDHRGILTDVRTYRSVNRQRHVRSSSNLEEDEEELDEDFSSEEEEMVPLNRQRRENGDEEQRRDIENPPPRPNVLQPLASSRQSSSFGQRNPRDNVNDDEFDTEEEGSFIGS